MRKQKEITRPRFSESDSDAGNLLESIIQGKETQAIGSGVEVFSQGANGDAIYFIRSGRVKVGIARGEVQEIAIAILGPGDFFGEGCLIGQSLRMNTVTTLESSQVIKIQKEAMIEAMKARPDLSEAFITALIVRNIDIEEDICSQLFNSTEKRLAHVLLKLDRFGRAEFLPDTKLTQVSHETLADLAGATHSQISNFLDRFRRLGLIHYDNDGAIVVRAKMLADIVLAV
jgi:CRP/FNR family cyclic AMP-dependent transcriptional regulator